MSGDPFGPLWLRSAHHGPDPACWDWDATEQSVGLLRQTLLRERAGRAPSGTPDEELSSGLGWELLVEWHQWRCAMCSQVRHLVVDHDHESGLIRGLLCGPCNVNEGHHSDARTRRATMGEGIDPPIFVSHRYRSMPPAAILGVAHRYAHRRAFPAWSRLALQGPIGSAPAHVLRCEMATQSAGKWGSPMTWALG